jgi:MATE family multidrug resistance protein
LTPPPDIPDDRIIDRYQAGSYRQAWVLSAPAILTMLSQTVMWTVDAAMVGHVGKAELAAVGFGGILVWTVYSFFVGLTSAVNTFVSQAYGAHEYRRCGMYLWQGLYIALGSAAVLYTLRVFVPQIMGVVNPPEDVGAMSASYIQIRMLSAVFFLVYYTCSHFFRGIGDTMTPLKVLALAHLVNLIGDYLLIFGKGPFPELGVEGAAWATSLANLVAAVLFIGRVFAPRMRRRYDFMAQWRPVRAEIVRITRLGLPIAVHFFLDMGSFLVFSAYIGRMGTSSLAANQIAIQILALSFMPAQGLAQAATTLMGQYIGAGRPDLAKRATHTTIKMGLYYAGFIAVLCLTIPEALVRIFNDHRRGGVVRVSAAGVRVRECPRVWRGGGVGGGDDLRGGHRRADVSPSTAGALAVALDLIRHGLGQRRRLLVTELPRRLAALDLHRIAARKPVPHEARHHHAVTVVVQETERVALLARYPLEGVVADQPGALEV